MNVCNFAKVIISRCSKRAKMCGEVEDRSDSSSDSEESATVENKENCGKEKRVPRYNAFASVSERYSQYVSLVQGHPKMMMNSSEFRIMVPRIEKIFRESRHWKSKTKGWAKDKQRFIRYFSSKKWLKLPAQERQRHKLKDCPTCHCNKHEEVSSLLIHSHKSKNPLQNIT